MQTIRSKRTIYIGAALCTLIIVLGIGQAVLENKATAQGRTVQAPMFEVDPLWPKPLPNLYTTETYEGKRVQKFAYKGMGPVTASQGVLWPRK